MLNWPHVRGPSTLNPDDGGDNFAAVDVWGESWLGNLQRIDVRGGDDWVTRNKMDRFIATIELIAAFFIGLVAVDIFLTVVLRNFFSMALPDSYDIGQLLLGILIFWGIAATSYRGTHITVDVVWANASPRYQRWIDVFATLVLLVRRGDADLLADRQGGEQLQRQSADV